MSECPFCKILQGELPSSVVHQDERCTAILDIQPINQGHVLILTNDHVESLTELDPGTGAHIFNLAQDIAAAIRNSGIQCEGINLLLADGKSAMQEVPHFHLHVIPRYAEDGFQFQFGPTYFELPTRDELNKNAEHIKRSLQDIRPEEGSG